MLKYYLTFIFLCATFIINSQNIPYSLNNCNQLLKSNKHIECIIECERVLFHSNSPREQKQALSIKGKALKNQHQFSKAAETFQQIRITSSKDTLFNEKFYEEALCNYLAGNFENTINIIQQFEFLSNNKISTSDIILIKILSLNSLFKFEESKELLLKYLNFTNSNDKIIATVNNLYKKRNIPKKKNPELAKNMSMIIPGLGHIYADRWIEGGISLALNAGALAFGIYHIYYGYYFTGYVVGFSLLHKFHSGGMKRSYILVETKNKKNIANFNKQFLSFWEQYL